MSELGQFENNYSEIYIKDETNFSRIYRCINNESRKNVCLKVIDKKKLKIGDYNYLLRQIKKEEEITTLCNSNYTVKLYRKLEDSDFIIFELEDFSENLGNYIHIKGPLGEDKNTFKNIVLNIAKALKIIHNKGIIHRDIKPYNIFIEDEESDEIKICKLGDFGSSVYIKDNISEPIGTIFYTAPEIIKNLKYDEKCDLWSLGVTLYELYFGKLPYGDNPNPFRINKVIHDEENFKFKKTYIPTLDILFKRLLVIDPKNRMDFDEFFEYVFSDDFMKEDIIIVNNNLMYSDIYNIILDEQEEEEKKIKEDKQKNFGKNENLDDLDNEVNDYEEEGLNEEVIYKKYINKILDFIEGEHLPDIMDYPNGSFNSEEIYNNIIYYDENINFMASINQDCDYFEGHTPGAFILCKNIDTLNLVKKEIIKENFNDERIVFNIVTTGSTFEKVMNYLEQNQDFKKCILKACIFCLNLKKYAPLKEKYKILKGVYNKQFQVVDFIKENSSNEIKPFPLNKLLRYEDYQKKYKNRHFKISQFYGNLTKETYKKYHEKMKSLIEKESKTNELKQKNVNKLFKAFESFDIKEDLKELDKLIIEEYTKSTFYGDLNKWLMKSKMNLYEPVAYFTARLMYSLNSYSKENNKFYYENKAIYRGIKTRYSNLIPYLRAKGRIICLSSFTSTSKDEERANKFAGRKKAKEIYETNLNFSVVYKITNVYHKNWIPSGIDVQEIAVHKGEKEIVFQPFTFYFVKDAVINIKEYTADIELETIGKIEILEEKIKFGFEIEYNQHENIIEIKK